MEPAVTALGRAGGDPGRGGSVPDRRVTELRSAVDGVRADVWSGGVPAEVTSFLGRRQEITEVKRLLTSARLVTLTGAAPT